MWRGSNMSAAKPPNRHLPACKCCGSETSWVGAVDVAVGGPDPNDRPFANSGVEADYFRCPACGFMFTQFLDGWSIERLKREIYNDDYLLVDPGFIAERPRTIAKFVDSVFGKRKRKLRILDYGGGNGETVKLLRSMGFKWAVNFDPFHDVSNIVDGTFDVVLAFEVIEHVPDPYEVFHNVYPRLRDGGVFVFSTLLQPDGIEDLGVAWWYVMSRNGHVSFHTAASLSLVANRYRMPIKSLNSNCHIAIKGKG